MYNFTSLEKLFIPATAENFPKDKCIIPDKSSKDVKYSENTYMCLTMDIRFPEEMNIFILRPWVYDNGEEIDYGWSKDKYSHFNNLYNCELGYDETVIGFVEYRNENSDKVRHNEFLEILKVNEECD